MMGGGHSIFFAPRASNEDPQQMLNIFAGPVSPIGGVNSFGKKIFPIPNIIFF
jgi:hypothetical protein